jgi:hypothetical protein
MLRRPQELAQGGEIRLIPAFETEGEENDGRRDKRKGESNLIYEENS